MNANMVIQFFHFFSRHVSFVRLLRPSIRATRRSRRENCGGKLFANARRRSYANSRVISVSCLINSNQGREKTVHALTNECGMPFSVNTVHLFFAAVRVRAFCERMRGEDVFLGGGKWC